MKICLLLFHVDCVTIFSASWEIIAGWCNRMGGPSVGVALSGISIITCSSNACGVSIVVSPSCSSSGTTGKTFVDCSRGDPWRLLVFISVRFLFCLGSSYQLVAFSFSPPTSAPSVACAWAPSVGIGIIPGVLLRVFLAWTLGALRIAAGAVGVLDVCGPSWSAVRALWVLCAKTSVRRFNASICRPGCSVAFCAIRRNDCVNAWARRLALSHSVSVGTLLCLG